MSNQHYYGVEDSHARIDYLLLSPAMKKYWLADETYIPTIPNWGIGSDHRPSSPASQPAEFDFPLLRSSVSGTGHGLCGKKFAPIRVIRVKAFAFPHPCLLSIIESVSIRG